LNGALVSAQFLCQIGDDNVARRQDHKLAKTDRAVGTAEPTSSLTLSPMQPFTKPTSEKPGRTWRAKFADAFRGLTYGIQGQSSFFVHFFLTALVLAAATVLACPLRDWIVLLLCIGLVLTAELFNSALEALFHGLDDRIKARCHRALDIAAAAVLMASITAAVVGSLVFVNRLSELLDWPLLGIS
jgi:diacylglycerol kinase